MVDYTGVLYIPLFIIPHFDFISKLLISVILWQTLPYIVTF